MPQKLDGCRTEPPVSVPSAHTTSSDATATTLPPLEPPGTRLVSTGFLLGPNAEFSVLPPQANSSKFVFPINTLPLPSVRLATVALYGAI